MSEPVNPSRTDRKRRSVLKAAGGGALFATPLLAAAPASAQEVDVRSAATARERRLKRLTLVAFERQATGGSFYDVLADDVIWTVAAAEPTTHYGREAFLANGSGPVMGRLSTTLVPEVRSIWAQNDTVVIHWDGSAVARDGVPYHNSYCWIWTYRGESVIKAVAFLDLVALNDLFDRIPLPS
ncbi:nuclear transport factor 2 family protein [Streptomyces sp. NPDC102274]|uniref:nuclear transport factor 2 family protein n=1 Tax=Streptomyces sp. NPDC102274 TaxID=3366151 RepID=UPI00382F6B57